MALDSYGVLASLISLCPLDGTAGPYASLGASIYPDGNGTFWRLDFASTSTTTQQANAITALASLTSYTPPVVTSYSPYVLKGTLTMSIALAVGTTTIPVPVSGLLRTDVAMIAFGTALPSGVDVRSQFPDPNRDGYLNIQVSLVSLLSGTTSVPFTLIGVR